MPIQLDVHSIDSCLAKAITPILPVPLEGPAYFVSHGNEAFPQLILVLQGYGITIDLVGDTFISKAGITSSTFAHVPDAPVSSFELTLPQGKYSALTANANLCTVKGGLKMPTEFVGQNGAVIHQSTPISVSGCPKAKTAAQLRAAKLAAALKACHKKKGSKRSGCERTAQKRYNPLKKKPSHKSSLSNKPTFISSKAVLGIPPLLLFFESTPPAAAAISVNRPRPAPTAAWPARLRRPGDTINYSFTICANFVPRNHQLRPPPATSFAPRPPAFAKCARSAPQPPAVVRPRQPAAHRSPAAPTSKLRQMRPLSAPVRQLRPAASPPP